MTAPPATSRTIPVIHAASSDARNRAARATSSPFLARFFERTGFREAAARVRHQDVDRTEFSFDFPAHGFDLGELGDIGGDLDHLPAGALDVGAHRGQGRQIPAVDR